MQPQLTTEQLLERLYAEAQHLNLDALENHYPQQLPQPAEQPPRLELPLRSHYDLEELLQFDGQHFIHNAYRALLQRNPDPNGLTSWQDYQAKEPRKTQLLLALLNSEEARSHGTHIQGLDIFIKLKVHPLAQRFPRLADRLATIKDRQANQRAQQRLMAPLQNLIQNQQQQLDQQINEINRLFYAPKSQLHLLHSRINQLEYRADLPHPTNTPTQPGTQTPETTPALALALDAFYLAFEQACRTDSEQLQQHLNQYLPALPAAEQAGPVIDIGCGRGEWLQLIKTKGYNGIGLEISPVMQDYCQRKGLQVHLHPFTEWLHQQPDHSLAAITAFQVVEHLPFEQVYALAQEARRTLQPGGLLLLETPNPENLLVGSHTFYHDPTHKNPLTPTLLKFLAGYLGFTDIQIIRSNPYPAEALLQSEDPTTQRLNGHLGAAQDFALLARQPAP